MAYTDEDLTAAQNAGILTEKSLKDLRKFIAARQNTSFIDEENFRFIASFNDVFVTIICFIVLAAGWLIARQWTNEQIAYIATAAISWGIAEYFTRIRRLSLPSILLLLGFITSVFYAAGDLPSADIETPDNLLQTLTAIVAAYLHWRRFRVPITIAATTAAVIFFTMTNLPDFLRAFHGREMLLLFLNGIFVLILAMWWDISDRDRISYRSDVAFWLHLIAAPLLIQPGFYLLFSREIGSMEGSLIIVMIYAGISFISIYIDRRALMVSSLVYVIYAVYTIFQSTTLAEISLAFPIFMIGVGLLILSAHWQKVRYTLVRRLPQKARNYLPSLPDDA